MKGIVIADRLTCIGYRLAGVDARVAEADGIAQAFENARAEADLLLITAPLAEELSEATLDEAIRLAAPPVQVIPAMTAPDNAPNVRAKIRRSLGVSE
ncbi:MAG: hypothetical protein HKN81_00020 [Gammaproteobacteria bacterium]|nr:V-type ATP synthase subunit F [Gammaproteobacteria bacterium]NND35494.1 hypothetical protein [Gammaproteobacteria bacterium]